MTARKSLEQLADETPVLAADVMTDRIFRYVSTYARVTQMQDEPSVIEVELNGEQTPVGRSFEFDFAGQRVYVEVRVL